MAIGGLLSFFKETIEEYIDNNMLRYGIRVPPEEDDNIVEWSIRCVKFMKTFFRQVTPTTPENKYTKIESPIKNGEEFYEYNEVPRPLFGAIVLAIFISVLVTVIVMPHFVVIKSKWFILFSTFFRIGCTIFGGGNVLVPMLLSELKDWITDRQFFDGFVIVSSLPGPL